MAKQLLQTGIPQCAFPNIENVKTAKGNEGTLSAMLHHDNASSYKAMKTREFLEENGLEELPHPPYSPDLAPCDFWLFLCIKKYLKGRIFSSNEEVELALSDILGDIEESEFMQALDRWFYRMDRCIKVGGEYLEQL